MTLLDLISIPLGLEDVHFFDRDEEPYDVHTVVELQIDMLTSAGREEWADVLNAEIIHILHGLYGIHITITGCKPHRITEFTSFLAGHYSISDTQKWLTPDYY